jgi:TolB-like protein
MQSFGRYTLLERLGEGALGELWRARDGRLGRTVALRLVAPALVDDPSRRSALLADASVAAGLSHPHIAALFDVGTEEGRVYLAHEFVPGASLKTLLAGRSFDVNLTLEFAVELADALAEAHRQGVVHGDLRPATIFITPTDQTKILDFGLGAWTSGGAARKAVASQLATGREPSVLRAEGLVSYLSPEQVLGEPIDARTDIFSLGVLLYHMLTGHAPFAGGTPARTALKILQISPSPPTRQNPAVPAAFDQVVGRALGKSLDARYGSASEMAADLRALAGQMQVPVTTATHAWPPRPRREWGPIIRRATAIGLVLLALAGIAAGAWYQRDGLRRLFERGSNAPGPVLVVMPFGMPPGETGRAYYGTGFAQDLAARLGEVPGLSVVGRTLAGRTPVPAELARQLGASVVLQGTTRPGPYALRVDAQLIDASTGRTLWSEHFARDPRQSATVQAEIARQVAEQLKLAVPVGNRSARALSRQVDPVAYDLFLQARDAADRRDRPRAVELYRQALATDDKLVEARVALSEVLSLEDPYWGGGGDADASGEARAEAEAALAVEPDMPRAHLAAALCAPTTAAAAAELARALSLDPSFGEAWRRAGELVVELDPARAIEFCRRSLRLDPALDANYRDMASALELLDRLPEAERTLALGQAMRPDREWWVQMGARFEVVRQHYASAAQMLAADPATDGSPLVWLMGRIVPLHLAARTDDARREATRLLEGRPWFCDGQAVLAGLERDSGDRGGAQAIVDRILAQVGSSGAPAQALACAALASAAIGDASGAAGYLSQVAGDDHALRAWTREAIFSQGLAFRRHWYPWNKVISAAPVQQATADLTASLERLRDEAARRLPAPPGR